MMKLCPGCGVEKQRAAFHRHSAKRDGLQARCKSCRRAHYDANKTGILARSSAWSKANRPAKRKARNAYYWRNRESEISSVLEWQSKNVGKRRANNARYLKKNVAHIGARKRAIKIGATPAWANTFFIREIYSLARLRSRLTGIVHEVDHIVPLRSPTVCGLHVEHNLRVIPRAENLAKGNRVWPDMP